MLDYVVLHSGYTRVELGYCNDILAILAHHCAIQTDTDR